MGILSKAGYRGESDDEKELVERIADWSDADCLEYLDALDSRRDLEVTEFESEFIDSNKLRVGEVSFSRKQRLVIAKMYDKYGD